MTKSIIIAALIALTSTTMAADLSKQQMAVQETSQHKSERLKWWKEARFGMFIHWGPVTLKGTEISWSRGGVPIEEYDNLYKKFNPTKFDAKKWVATAKAAGMKYVVFTAKHHDGFCEWPSKATAYNISNSPFKRDVCAELAKAAHDAGMKIGWYYSPGDWSDPDCRTERNDLYVARMKQHLTELLTNYGKIDMLWFDYDGRPVAWDSAEIYKLARTLQPHIIINNRLDMTELADYEKQIMGPNADYYTPEQRVGSYDDKVDWETTMTMACQWAWRPNDPTKSTKECLQTLVSCVGGDGNLLFNVGPDSLGEIEPLQISRLKEMGDWLKKYGESVYGTRGGPYKPNGEIVSTRKSDTIYLHVFNSGAGSVVLPGIPQKVKSAALLTGGKVSFKQTDESISISIPRECRREIDTIVKLKLDGSAMSIPAVDVPKSVVQVRGFRLEDVLLLDSPFKTAMELNRKVLNELDADRLLHTFRVTAGLPSSAKPLGGWEKPECELRGHCMGHFLSGCALAYASSGDKALKAKVDYIVAELAKCQDAMSSQGYNKGYLSAYPESLFDRVDKSEQVWAPWYTYHKIMAGLIDAYNYCENKQALEVLKKMSAWVKFRTDRLSDEKFQSSLNNEFGGMGEALANLYVITKNPDDLALARRFDKKWFTDALARGEDCLNGQHSNTHIPQVVSSARLYELTGEKRYADISTYFWKNVVGGRCYAGGGTSNVEGWHSEAGKLSRQMGSRSQESCCTYNMLKLTKQLFTWTPDANEADYYERALYNCILPTIYPTNGMTMYYVSLQPSHWKVFCSADSSFWCCTGTGWENHAKYGESIYFHDEDSLYVNLFVPSELNYSERGMKVRLETEFPEKDTVTLAVTARKPVRVAMKIRVPYWATNGVTVKVNGKLEKVEAKPSSYITLDREWKTGDKIELQMPMSLHLAPMPDDNNLVAVMYGPILLAAELGTKDFTNDLQFGKDQPFDHTDGPFIDVPDFAASGKPVNEWVKPVQGKSLTWRTSGVGRPNDVNLMPFYKLFDERYTIYLQLNAEGVATTLERGLKTQSE